MRDSMGAIWFPVISAPVSRLTTELSMCAVVCMRITLCRLSQSMTPWTVSPGLNVAPCSQDVVDRLLLLDDLDHLRPIELPDVGDEAASAWVEGRPVEHDSTLFHGLDLRIELPHVCCAAACARAHVGCP